MRLFKEGVASTWLTHQVAVGLEGGRGGRAETARVNKDYVTGALMSFSSKQLLPPFFYLIKVFHLQPIQRRALLHRRQREHNPICRTVPCQRLIFHTPFCKLTAGSRHVSHCVPGLSSVSVVFQNSISILFYCNSV